MLVWLLAISNFLFVGSYAIIGPHALFMNSWDVTSTEVVVTGMAIFGATQIGGVWFLSLIDPKLEKSIRGLFLTRLFAILLIFIPNGISVALSLVLFGLSHSIFYKISRGIARDLIYLNYNFSERAYLLFGLTTNFAYILFVGVGSSFIELKKINFLMIFVLLIFFVSSIILFKIKKIINFKVSQVGKNEVYKEKSEESQAVKIKINEKLEVNDNKTVFLDLIRLTGFALPYAVLQALIPIKVLNMGHGSEYNAFLTAVNSVVVVLFQLIGLFFKKINIFNSRIYDFTVIVAFISLAISVFADLPLFALILFLWSFVEAYQIPSIEHLIFTQRSYSDKAINRFLVIDSAICFLGPYLAIINKSTIFFSSPYWMNYFFKHIKL